nr:MAG TPA: hypothetical protein [Caudoviricetes sp.]
MTRKRAAKGTTNGILVTLKQPYRGKTLWLFGCKAAIYDHLPSSVVGIAKTTLQSHVNLQQPYENNFCTIQRITLYRKRQTTQNNEPQ